MYQHIGQDNIACFLLQVGGWWRFTMVDLSTNDIHEVKVFEDFAEAYQWWAEATMAE